MTRGAIWPCTRWFRRRSAHGVGRVVGQLRFAEREQVLSDIGRQFGPAVQARLAVDVRRLLADRRLGRAVPDGRFPHGRPFQEEARHVRLGGGQASGGAFAQARQAQNNMGRGLQDGNHHPPVSEIGLR